jgi:hypothetical protein
LGAEVGRSKLRHYNRKPGAIVSFWIRDPWPVSCEPCALHAHPSPVFL